MSGPILRKYATATAAGTHIRIPVIKAGAQDFATNSDWTPAAGDVKLSKDGAAQANIGTLPTYSNGAWEFQLTALEVTAKQVEIMVVDSATKAVEDQSVLIETFGHASAMYLVDYTTHMAQTGDSYARLGAPAGASVSADVAAVKGETASILTDTAEIGVAGAGLTDLGGMSTTMKDQVNAEADTALSDINLDHLMKIAVANNDDMTAEVVDGTVLCNIMTSTSDTSTYVRDSHALRSLYVKIPSECANTVWEEQSTGHLDAGKAGAQLWTDIDAILVDTGTDGVQVADKSGYSLAADQSAVTIGTVSTLTGHTAQSGDTYAALPTNFNDLAITVTTGYVSVGTNNDKTGYGLAADQSAVTIGTVNALTGHTVQTGDSYAVVNSGTFGNAQLVRATTPANALDVNATGEAGIDLDNTSGTLAKGTDITGFTDLSAADVNAQVDGALNTAIPGSPTADSINERVKAIDVLTEADGAGDLAFANKFLNNRKVIDDTADTLTLYDDDDTTIIAVWPLKDADGNGIAFDAGIVAQVRKRTT